MTQRLGNEYTTPIGKEFGVNTTIWATNPDITGLTNGGFVVFWQSSVNSQSDGDAEAILGQKFAADGSKIGDEFIVNDWSYSYQLDPTATTLSNGNVVVFYESRSINFPINSSYSDSIAGRMLDQNGNMIGGEFVVNSNLTQNQYNPHVAAFNGGGFIVTWMGWNSVGSKALLAQRFDNNGAKIGAEIDVFVSTNIGTSWRPTVTTFANDGFLVTWAGADADSYGIIAQRFDDSGSAIGSSYTVNDTTAGDQKSPSGTSLEDGKYLIVWEGKGSSDTYGIYAKAYNTDGTVAETEFLVNSNTFGNQERPQVVALNDGGFVVFWRSVSANDVIGDAGWAIAGQRYDAQFNKTGEEFVINSWHTKTLDADQFLLSATVLDDGKLLVSWQSDASPSASGNYYEGISVQIFDPTGTVNTEGQWIGNDTVNPVGDEILVNTTISNDEGAPTIATLQNGNFVVAMGDGNNDIAIQIFDADGNKISSEILVPTYISATQSDSEVIGLENGNFVVAWSTPTFQGGNSNDISAQLFTASGTKIGSEFLLNTTITDSQIFPDIVATEDGGFLAVWQQSNTTTNYNNIMAQFFDASGNKIGSEITVESVQYITQYVPSVDRLVDGNYIIAWHAAGDEINSSDQGIKAKVIDNTGTTVTNTFWVNNFKLSTQDDVKVAALTTGGFVATWYSYGYYTQGDAGGAVAARIFDKNGIPLGNEFKVNTNAQSSQQDPAVIATEDGGFVITWMSQDAPDYLAGTSGGISGQRFDYQGNSVGNEFLVNTYIDVSTNGGVHDKNSLTLLKDGRIASVWESESHPGDLIRSNVSLQLFDLGCIIGAPIQGTANADLIERSQACVHDFISSLAGNDLLDGGVGNDTLDGGGDNDTLNGGAGNDSLLGGASGTDSLLGGDGDDIIDGESNHDTLYGGNGNDTLYGGITGNDTLYGEAGADLLQGGTSQDVLDGGADNDTLLGGDGNDTLIGGAGDDSLMGGETGTDSLSGGDGNDLLNGESNNDTLYGGNGNDTLYGGSSGMDALYGEAGDDYLSGESNHDVLDGGAGNDTLTGGEGSDTLTGGDGADVLTGDSNADRFVYTALSESSTGASDLLTDFVQGLDVIDLAALGFSGIQSGAASGTVLGYSFSSGNTIVTADGSTFSFELTGEITLANTDFIFV